MHDYLAICITGVQHSSFGELLFRPCKRIDELTTSAEAVGVAFGKCSSLLIAMVDGKSCVMGNTYSLLEDMVAALISTPDQQVLAGYVLCSVCFLCCTADVLDQFQQSDASLHSKHVSSMWLLAVQSVARSSA